MSAIIALELSIFISFDLLFAEETKGLIEASRRQDIRRVIKRKLLRVPMLLVAAIFHSEANISRLSPNFG